MSSLRKRTKSSEPWINTFNPSNKLKRKEAPASNLVVRKLSAELEQAGEEDDMLEILKGQYECVEPNQAIEKAREHVGTPEIFAHDWTSSDLTLAPEHKWFGEDASYQNHRSYPASCSDPKRRELYYSCLTSNITSWSKQMWRVAHLVDESLIAQKRIDHAFSEDDSEIIDPTVQTPLSTSLQSTVTSSSNSEPSRYPLRQRPLSSSSSGPSTRFNHCWRGTRRST